MEKQKYQKAPTGLSSLKLGVKLLNIHLASRVYDNDTLTVL